MPVSENAVAENYTSGHKARDALATELGPPHKEVAYNELVPGKGRRHDVMGLDDQLYEVKVGYTSLGKSGRGANASRVRQELARDIFLKQKRGKEITWGFYVSESTGLGGPSGPLRTKLQKYGINIEIRSESF